MPPQEPVSSDEKHVRDADGHLQTEGDAHVLDKHDAAPPVIGPKAHASAKSTPLARSESTQGSAQRKSRVRSASPSARQDGAVPQETQDKTRPPPKMQHSALDRPRSRRSAAGDSTRQLSQSSDSRATSPVSSSGGPDLELAQYTAVDDGGNQAGRRSLRRPRSPSTDAAPTPEARRASADSTEPANKRAALNADQRLNPHKRAREAKRIKIRYVTIPAVFSDVQTSNSFPTVRRPSSAANRASSLASCPRRQSRRACRPMWIRERDHSVTTIRT